jgi:large subunit ribosomal protein L23
VSQKSKYQVLLSPVLTEKTTIGADKYAQHAFKVAKEATKGEIKNAVEKIFNVKVKSVQTLNCKGKAKRFGAIMGKRKDSKKAIVRLQDGFDISFSE